MAQQHLLYGTNILASDLAPQLEAYERNQQGVNAWRNLFGNASLQNMAAQDTLKTDYASAAAEAYKTYQKQKNDAFAARLAPGATADIAAQANRDFINSAYSQYVSKYLEDANKLAENYGNTITGISDSLTERAENYASLYRSAYDYLAKELAGAEKTVDNVTSGWLADNSFADFLTKKGDLRSWNDISKELFDADRNLTNKGRRFYDVVFNADPKDYITVDEKTGEEGRTRGFDEWLATSNPTLRDWYVSGDYITGGKQSTNVKQGLGLEDRPYTSRDYTDFSDYAGYGIKEFDKDDSASVSAKAIKTLKELQKEYNDFKISEEIGKYLQEKRKKGELKEHVDWTPAYNRAREIMLDKKKSLNEKYSEAMKTYRNYIRDYYDGIVNALTADSFAKFSKENASLVEKIESLLTRELTDVQDVESLTEEMQNFSTAIAKFSSENVGSGIKVTTQTPASVEHLGRDTSYRAPFANFKKAKLKVGR